MGKKFSSILVANRGEIAVRILRTAKALGYRTIAVYSEADAAALHVQLADEAVLLGPAPAAQSYLDPARLLAAAAATGAVAIHPGYGFLSENAAFADACAAAGLVFIGPPPSAMRAMANKADAKRRMMAAGVPCVPGYEGADQSDGAFMAAAKKIGFPVMVKASAGGGGRGMRLVKSADGLKAALATARDEARAAFGSDELILEKALVGTRHVEIQVMADAHGTTLHLGERDCSVQRRHQKIIEETPCPVLTPDQRQRMGKAAVTAAEAVGYTGAGTVEFLLDASGDFYFLEMNTRLQVEHPVTEMVTGLDLVALQIHVAQGEPLALKQQDIILHGHAIEARLCAEDPARDFMPVTGQLLQWQPATGDHVRVDHGLVEGQEIPPFYDSMLAKVIAWGEDRDTARARLAAALKNTCILGPLTNRDYLADLVLSDGFANGEATTTYLADGGFGWRAPDEAAVFAHAAIAAALLYRQRSMESCRKSLMRHHALMDWHSSLQLRTPIEFDGMDMVVTARGNGELDISDGARQATVQVLVMDDRSATLGVDGCRFEVAYAIGQDGQIHLDHAGRILQFQLRKTTGSADHAIASGDVAAPMHGRITRLDVTVGDKVRKGQIVAVIEAMKMQMDIAAPVSGVIGHLAASVGAQIAPGAPFLRITPQE